MSWLASDRAQATVEMAVVAPVLLVLALSVFNVMMFAAAVARFDRVAPDVVLAQGVSPAGDGTQGGSSTGAVQSALEDAMQGYDLQIEVSCEGGDSEQGGMLALVGSARTYTCRMKYRPWPSGFSIAGVSLGAPAFLQHERAVTVDPWRPGVIV